MKAVILAGGLGTRLSEETVIRPKPMVEVGGKPILWHIMKIYSSHGINDFVICLGYKGEYIRSYFANYFLNGCDVTFDLRDGSQTIHTKNAEPWRVTLVDTGQNTQVGGRIKRIIPYVADDKEFCLTYGDGVGNVDITKTIALHRAEGRLATVTATQPPGRFGILRTQDSKVLGFREKPEEGGWINGGYFVLSPKVGAYIADDSTVWEREPLERLADEGQLSVHHHDGFWQPMDTLRDRGLLEDLWASGKAPWKVW
ncbi:glucose-1-phosphate cytidylyltransferase [Terrihabitans soli]|uniref:Glucose-1-phosphate cytidylyltransferase n=1 Tax=Terrihabitans soli TaxID=708113 RepID=A0A6S6QXB6_9HYPH|nr:glucose-1-phosphate cytidylyltransferase [Terrihabitans soli]BCJ91912.1 glucose-1-phosphate cytidylyltransferase [Terrihabitans soli]